MPPVVKFRKPIASPETGILYLDLTITAAQVKTLNATPLTLVPAPGAGKWLEFVGAELFMDYGSAAFDGVAAGEDLSVKYTNGAGLELGQCETTGFLDQTSDQRRCIRRQTAATGSSAFTPAVNAALVLHMLVGEVGPAGDSPVKVRTFYTVHSALA